MSPDESAPVGGEFGINLTAFRLAEEGRLTLEAFMDAATLTREDAMRRLAGYHNMSYTVLAGTSPQHPLGSDPGDMVDDLIWRLNPLR